MSFRKNTEQTGRTRHASSARHAVSSVSTTASTTRSQSFIPATSATAANRPTSATMRTFSDEQLTRVRKKRSKAPKIALIVVAVLLAVILVPVAALAIWVNALNSSMNFDDEQELADLKASLLGASDGIDTDDDESFYMLILGSDAREEGESSRSDVTMLARVSPEDGVVDLISIPRDTMVTIEGHGTQKINAAYSFGGAAGAVDCVSEFAGVSISHYASINFEELEQLVDALGGIWVDVPESFSAGNGGISFEAGEQLLNGEQALAFARERYNVSGGDFGRAQAQRIIVKAIIDQVLACTPSELPGIISELAECVTTDYSVGDLVLLARGFQDANLTVYSAVCPSYTLNQDGVSYVGTMFDEWQDMMRRVDASLDPNGEDEIPEPQASDTTLGAATNSPAPRDYESLAASAGLTTDDVVETQ